MAIELHHLNTHGMMEQACDVLDGVVRLKERIAELEEERRWRKFPDEKPEEWDTVIVRIGDGFYDLAVYMSNGQGWDIGDGTYHKPEEVTHWMPLPSAPKEGE
jgi:hypothetical protein